MRPPLHAIAPSTSVLRYLHQILFPRSHGYHPVCMSFGCPRVQYRGARITSRQQQVPPEKKTPAPAPPLGRARAKSREWWDAFKKKKLSGRVNSVLQGKYWQWQCHRLIHAKQLDEATKKWLHAKDNNADKKDLGMLGKSLMKAFNQNQRTRGTPRIFAMMFAHDPSSIDTRCLNLVLQAYLMNDRPEKVFAVFKHFQETVKPDWKTFEIILRNFILLGRLKEAENLIRLLLEKGGPVTPSSFAALLHGVSERTRDLEEMRRIVEWMKTTGVKPHKSIYNIMIKAALDHGRPSLAREYAEEMVVRGLQYNTDTFVLFLSTQSAACDWAGVRRTIERMHSHNLKISTEGFNTLLRSYATTTTELSHTQRFFDSMVSAGITPNRFSFNIMVHACTRVHDHKSKERWITRMKDAGFPPDAVTFNILFYEISKAHVPAQTLRRVYAAAAAFNPNIVNTRTKHILLNSMRKESILPYLSRRHPPPTGESLFTDEIRAMDLAMEDNRLQDVICIFSEVISRGFKPSPPLIARIIHTVFRLSPSEYDDVSRLLFVAHERGARINEIFMDVITTSDGPTNASITSSHRLAATLERLVEGYSFMNRSFLPVSHYVLIQSAWSLILEGDAQGAITLLHQMANTRWAAQFSKWEVVGLTVMLKAYTEMRDIAGVGWVVEQVLEGDMLPDSRFMMYLRRAKECVQSSEDEGFVRWCVARCLKSGSKLRGKEANERAMEMLRYFHGVGGKNPVGEGGLSV